MKNTLNNHAHIFEALKTIYCTLVYKVDSISFAEYFKPDFFTHSTDTMIQLKIHVPLLMRYHKLCKQSLQINRFYWFLLFFQSTSFLHIDIYDCNAVFASEYLKISSYFVKIKTSINIWFIKQTKYLKISIFTSFNSVSVLCKLFQWVGRWRKSFSRHGSAFWWWRRFCHYWIGHQNGSDLSSQFDAFCGPWSKVSTR